MTYEKVYEEYDSILRDMIQKKGIDISSYSVQKIARIVQALGKQINRDVEMDKDTFLLVCPTCRHEFNKTTRQKYCDECGQRLSWHKVR